jgi:DNA-binding NarL/FixJ family response regulator
MVMKTAKHEGTIDADAAARSVYSPRVVLVDDVADVRDIVREYLEEEGIEVTGEAGTGEEGIRLVAEDEPDVVIMDVRLPDMDGVEAARLIKEQRPGVSVLMLTFYDEPAMREEASEAGVRAFFTKTGTFAGLVDAIRDAAPARRPAGTTP